VNAQLVAELRPVGFAVAYRMLGSVSEAEDIVQEAFLRLHHTLQDGERIESPRAYLSTVVTRLCINHLRSARARRETYLEALPEPLVGEAGVAVALVPASGPAGVADPGDPASHAEMADSLSLAFLVLLETLSPEQRAAFLLREVFDYPYDQIAAIVGTSEQNARQLVARARRHVEQRRPRFEPSRRQRFSLREVTVNGQPGAMVLDPSERLIGVVALDIAEGGQIQAVTSVINPDKLRHLGPLADLGPLGGRGGRGRAARGSTGPPA
jgi:RNA polymerase sigma-70 factor (ECF subfamily)